MASIKLEGISKIYPGTRKNGDVLAVNDFNLEIKGKEFIVFVGPSGCGKSTTLRMIAGLEDITKGNLYIDGELINSVEPKYRNIAMVFQNYALYPHMTAYDNMAFGLRNMKIPTLKVGKDGKAIKGIDKHAISDLEFELKQTYRKIKKAKKLNDIEGINGLENEIIRINKDLEYFKQTPTNLYVEKHLKKSEIDQKIHEAAKILDIENLLNRRPGAMSGGQRQRVALGRAIVRTPKAFLLDEPLSNLDAKLRSQMRVEISKLYSKLDVPFIYVTHDQVEAMTMGTRIVVMRDGVVQQIDTPSNLYDYPANRFVAGFLGTPQMNFYETKIISKKGEVSILLPEKNTLCVKSNEMRDLLELYKDGKEHDAIVGIRSEDVVLATAKDKGFKVKINLIESLGSETLAYCDFNLKAEIDINNSKSTIIIKIPGRSNFKIGDTITVKFKNEKIHLFSSDEEKSILIKK